MIPHKATGFLLFWLLLGRFFSLSSSLFLKFGLNELKKKSQHLELFSDMTMDDVRDYEKKMHEKTNIKVCNQHSSTVDEIESNAQGSVCSVFKSIVPPLPVQTKTNNVSLKVILCMTVVPVGASFISAKPRFLLRPIFSVETGCQPGSWDLHRHT